MKKKVVKKRSPSKKLRRETVLKSKKVVKKKPKKYFIQSGKNKGKMRKGFRYAKGGKIVAAKQQQKPKKPRKSKSEQLGKREVKKFAEFETFLLWKSIPAVLKKTYKKKPELVKDLGFDISDSVFAELLSIDTQSEFAAAFNVSMDTLTDWKKRPDYEKKLNDLVNDSYVMRFKKDIDFNFTQKTLKECDKPRVKLWKQLYEGWQEKQELTLAGQVDNPSGGVNMVELLNTVDPKTGRKVGEIMQDAIDAAENKQ